MARMRCLVMAALIVIGGFFNQGCLGDAGGALAKGGLDGAKAWLEEKLAAAWPSLEAKLIAVAEAKLAEKEAKVNADFDAHLLKVAPPDPATGGKLAKTWKDFDVDKSGHLEPTEVAKITAYILAEGRKRVSDGSMSEEEWSATAKGVTAGSPIALAVGGGWWWLKRRKKALEEKKDPAAAGDPPKPPQPAPSVPSPATG